MTELLAAVAAFLLAALTGGRLAGWLQKKGMGRSLMVKKGESVTPGQEDAPEFGALPLLIGFINPKHLLDLCPPPQKDADAMGHVLGSWGEILV